LRLFSVSGSGAPSLDYLTTFFSKIN